MTNSKEVHKGDQFQKNVRFAIIGGKSTEESGVIPSKQARYTHVQFRRFAGCPVCNLHLRTFIKQKDILAEKGIEEIIIFHSTPKDIQYYEQELPFKIVADPKKQLYKSIGLEPSIVGFLKYLPHIPAVFSSFVKAYRAGERKIPPMVPKGGYFGMPGDLLLDANGTVVAAHYGKNLFDQWSVQQLYDLVEKA